MPNKIAQLKIDLIISGPAPTQIEKVRVLVLNNMYF